MLRLLIGEYVLRRLFGSSRHHRRSRYGWHRPRHHGTYYPGWGRPRTRSRSRVHVSGCCLPIPLGVLVALAAAGRLVSRR